MGNGVTVLGSLGDQSKQFGKGVDSMSDLIKGLAAHKTDIANALSLSSNVTNNLSIGVYGLVLVVAMLAFPVGLQGLLRQLWVTARLRAARGRASSA